MCIVYFLFCHYKLKNQQNALLLGKHPTTFLCLLHVLAQLVYYQESDMLQEKYHYKMFYTSCCIMFDFLIMAQLGQNILKT